MMEHYLIDYYGDAFETLLEGEYRVIEHTDSTLIVKKLGGALPEMTWRKISGA